MSETGNQIQAINLGCVRGERVLFQGLGFTLGSGQIMQVRGANGSGKSSLLRILCGLLVAEQGEVRWNGQGILDEREQYLAQIAYLGHLHGVKDELTVSENMTVSAALAGWQCGDGEIKAALHRLGLSSYAASLVGTLSAGQKRRLALARFLPGAVPLWIMDEPFTALDAAGRELLAGLISEHAHKGGLCVLASHEPLQVSGASLSGLDL